MLPFRKVIFPVDYSEACNAVIPYVRDVLNTFHASLTLIHAYGAEALAYSDMALTDVELPEEVRQAEEERLRVYAAETFPGKEVRTVIRLGDAGMVIHELVRHEGADLVMLGTRGNGPMRRFLLGSVCSKVLHDVSTAVWTGVGSELASHTPKLPYKSILCPIELGEEGEVVAVGAQALAKTYGAKLFLVNVVETPPAAMEIDFAPLKQEMVIAAGTALSNLKEKLGLVCEHSVVEGPIAEAIRDEAVRRHADLIVTGRGHAQGSFSRLWSHLYPIIRQAPCPVLSV